MKAVTSPIMIPKFIPSLAVLWHYPYCTGLFYNWEYNVMRPIESTLGRVSKREISGRYVHP
jgi:hypothetical protein